MMTRIFRHYVPTSMMLLALSEALVFFLSMHLTQSMDVISQVDRGAPPPPTHVAPTMFALVMLLSLSAAGLYQRGLREGLPGITLRLGIGFLLGALVMTLIFNLLPAVDVGQRGLQVALGTALVAVSVTRLALYSLADHGVLARRVLVLGAGEHASLIEQQLRRRTDRREMEIVGYIQNRYEASLVDPQRLVPAGNPLPDLVRERDVDDLVVALDNRRQGFPIDELIECKLSGVQVTDLLTFLERQTGKIQLDVLYPGSLVFLDGFSHTVLRRGSKRLVDITMSILLLSVTLPLMLLAPLAIWVESGAHGPIFYRQVRVGRDGRHFKVLKFRSMRRDAESDGVARWASAHDSRITRVGAFIRKTRIDELPQLFNVLRGDMSFVGPRPERPEFVEELSKRIPYYATRHRVNPGITGWAQVCYPYGASLKDAKEKLQYDLYYLKNFSLFLDLMIVVQTIQVVLWNNGAR